jgi:hypothetical protein
VLLDDNTVSITDLDRCAENMDSSSDHESAHAKHLLLLIDHLKHTYAFCANACGINMATRLEKRPKKVIRNMTVL